MSQRFSLRFVRKPVPENVKCVNCAKQNWDDLWWIMIISQRLAISIYCTMYLCVYILYIYIYIYESTQCVCICIYSLIGYMGTLQWPHCDATRKDRFFFSGQLHHFIARSVNCCCPYMWTIWVSKWVIIALHACGMIDPWWCTLVNYDRSDALNGQRWTPINRRWSVGSSIATCFYSLVGVFLWSDNRWHCSKTKSPYIFWSLGMPLIANAVEPAGKSSFRPSLLANGKFIRYSACFYSPHVLKRIHWYFKGMPFLFRVFSWRYPVEISWNIHSMA